MMPDQQSLTVAESRGSTPALEGASLKRIAWAFGCAKKGTDEERELERLLVERVSRG